VGGAKKEYRKCAGIYEMKMGNFYLPPGSIEEFARDGMKGAIPQELPAASLPPDSGKVFILHSGYMGVKIDNAHVST
jgi:hypothetical protein